MYATLTRLILTQCAVFWVLFFSVIRSVVVYLGELWTIEIYISSLSYSIAQWEKQEMNKKSRCHNYHHSIGNPTAN